VWNQRLVQRFAQAFGAGDRSDGDPALGQRSPERFLARTMLDVPEQLRRALRIFTEQEHQPWGIVRHPMR
jgi:hypothetical protein